MTLTIPGCGPDGPVRLDAPAVVSLAPVRCPEPDRRAKVEFARTTPRPGGAVDKDGVRAWIDKLEISERRKNAHGRQLIAELERCRGDTTSDATS